MKLDTLKWLGCLFVGMKRILQFSPGHVGKCKCIEASVVTIYLALRARAVESLSLHGLLLASVKLQTAVPFSRSRPCHRCKYLLIKIHKNPALKVFQNQCCSAKQLTLVSVEVTQSRF